MAGRGQAQLSGAGTVQQPCRQHARVDQRRALVGDALAVERLGAQPADAVRIIDDPDVRPEHGLAHLVLEEADTAGDGAAGDGADEMADESGGHPGIVDNRHGCRFGLARVEARHSAFAGAASHRFGAFEVARMAGTGAVIVALHARALAGQNGDTDAAAGAGITAEKSFGGGQRNRAAAVAGAAALRIGHALDGHGRGFDRPRPFDQQIGRGLVRIFQVERRIVARQQLGRGQPGIAVFRRQPGHRHGPVRQFGQRLGRVVCGRDEGHARADEDAQAQVGAFRAFDVFQISQPVGDARRSALHQKGIGRVGAGFACGLEQLFEDALRSLFCLCCHALTKPQLPARRQATGRRRCPRYRPGMSGPCRSAAGPRGLRCGSGRCRGTIGQG